MPRALRNAALHLTMAVLVTWPMALSPLRRLVGSPLVDVWNHAWGPWWWWASLREGRLPWRTSYLLWPEGGVLWFIDPVLAALGAPLQPVVGLAGAYNAVMLLYVAFASWALGRFARALGAQGPAPWVASAAGAASAWVTCELHNGISEALGIGFVALALAWTEHAARAGTRRAWARAGLGVGLCAVASPYLGLATGIAALVRGLPCLPVAWPGGLVAAAITAPPALLLRAQLVATDAIVKHPSSMNDELALHNAVDPRTFVAPLGFRSVDLSAEGFEHSMYLGLATLCLALLAGLRRPRATTAWWWAAALACAVFSLGPWLYWGDGWVTTGAGARLRLPWWLMQRLAPGLAVSHPLRLAVPTLAIVAALAAREAWDRLGARRALLVVPLVLFDGLVLSGGPWPLETADATPPAVYADLSRTLGDPLKDGILDLPSDAGSTMATSRYLAWQASHQRPIPYAPDARASTCSLLREPPFRAWAKLSRRRPEEHRRLGLEGNAPGSTYPSRLRSRGIRWIVVHEDIDPDAATAIEASIAADLGPGQRVDSAVVWDLGG